VARADPFNCLGEFSDDPDRGCAELRYTKTGDDLIGAHKTPSLRNVAETAPYMHAGQMHTLADILDLYNRAPLALIGHNEAKPLNLSGKELRQLEAFLHSLSGTLATEPRWLTRP
jgi:cytochrome c peroxidase